jgi:hypothetical protein
MANLKFGVVGLFALIFVSSFVSAVCPVCTIAVGGGIGLLRWFGVDDLITGVWVGGLLVSITLWTISWFSKKNINFKFRGIATGLFYYAIVIIPLYWKGIIGNPLNLFFGMDKLLLGIVLGSLAFSLAVLSDSKIRDLNGGKKLFSYQKVLIPLLCLVIISFIVYVALKLY